ncbi:MAG: DUF4168 domain-containing protein [Paracoccaceae bacterium]
MTTRHSLASAAAVALALLVGGAAIPAFAQTSGGGAAEAEAYSDQKLAAVAEVMTEIQTVRAEYTAEIEATQDPDEQQRLVREGNQELAAVVEDAPDVSAEELTEILEAAANNPELSERLDAEMRRAAE